MKKCLAGVLLMGCLLLAGCGGMEEPQQSSSYQYPEQLQLIETLGSVPAALRKVFVQEEPLPLTANTPQGDYTIDMVYRDEHGSAPSVRLTLVDKEGGLQSVTYGGSGQDRINDAAFVEGRGFIARVWSNSPDGEFYRAREYGEEVLVLFGEALEIKWQRPQSNLGSNEMVAAQDAVYLTRLADDNTYEYRGYDYDGRELFCKRFTGEVPRLICSTEQGLLLMVQQPDSAEKQLFLYDNDAAIAEVLFDPGAGELVRAAPHQGGWVMESVYAAGHFAHNLPQDGDSADARPAWQRVITCYDSQGAVLWRGATPPYEDSPPAFYE